MKKKKKKNFPITVINPDPRDFDFADIDGIRKKITKKKNQIHDSVTISQVLENGVWSLETQFNEQGQCQAVGIVENSYNIPACADLAQAPYNMHVAFFTGHAWSSGKIYCKGTQTPGNAIYIKNQFVKAEYNSDKGTLIFFINGVQQPVYISGIKEKVRFFIFMFHAGATCVIHSMKKLADPTSGHVANEKAVQW
ncbi:MAG: hypothetical protein EZS28_010350 [Streblomastix strix]|uniref:SPRY domain-containing protein n=1 Tax=Streblomastix strix TaxID=222440 RepID=A0A5J4WHE1_9EUKA|nr:MAG: hypothetical protein EZS28_010350 [Streblomastix strix]